METQLLPAWVGLEGGGKWMNIKLLLPRLIYGSPFRVFFVEIYAAMNKKI